MSLIKILDVQHAVGEAAATDAIMLQVDIQCVCKLQHDMELRTLYVADGKDSSKDQILDSVDIGPIEQGNMRFTIEVPAPDLTEVPKEHILDVSCIYISFVYQNQEFSRIGWYVRHERLNQPKLMEEAPDMDVDEDMPHEGADAEEGEEDEDEEEEEEEEPDAPGPDDVLPEVKGPLDFNSLKRIIQIDSPHVTHFSIKWDAPQAAPVAPQMAMGA